MHESHLRAIAAARAAEAKSAHDIVVLDVGDIISIVETFVIVSASNSRAVTAVTDNIEAVLRDEYGAKARASEGKDSATWILLDYGDMLVHVFLDETRRFYDLERLWADAARIDWETEEIRARTDANRSVASPHS